MIKLRLHTAYAAMQMIAQGGAEMALSFLNISAEDVALCKGATAWSTTDRPRVRRVLDAYLYGCVDALGLPRFELPAEYVAAIIAVFVHPCNYFAACTWITGAVSQEELLSGKSGKVPEGFEKVKPSQLFAIIIELQTKSTEVAKSYEKKMLANAQNEPLGTIGKSKNG